MKNKVSELYSVVLADLERDRFKIIGLWKQIQEDYVPDEKHLDWFYINNPAGKGSVYFLWHIPENRPVGVICASRRTFVFRGEELNAAILADFVIEPSHRTLGPGIFFEREVFSLTLEKNDLLYGFPNQRSALVGRKAGIQIEPSMSTFVLPIQLSCYIDQRFHPRVAKFLGSISDFFYSRLLLWRCREKDKKISVESILNSEDVDQIGAKNSEQQKIIAVRDGEYFFWRIKQPSVNNFEVFSIKDSIDQHPVGYILYRQESGGLVTIYDLVASNNQDYAELLRHFIKKMMKNKTQSISFDLLNDEKEMVSLLKRFGFSSRRDVVLHIIVTEKIKSIINDYGIYISRIDNDV